MDSTVPLNPESYSWQQSSLDASIWLRPALAGECMWTQRPRELRKIFLCGSLTLNTPISPRTFSACVRRAWKLLRFKTPELGVRTIRGTNEKFFIQYHTIDDREAQEWVDRTHSCQNGSQERDFEELRNTLLAEKQSQSSDNAFILSSAILEDGAEVLEHTQIMICIDHQIADGIGTRIVLGKFLQLLADSLGTAPDSTETGLNWEESRQNLSPPWICCMNDHQLISGPEYKATAAANRDVILNQMVIQHPVQNFYTDALSIETQPRPPTSAKFATSNARIALFQSYNGTNHCTPTGHQACHQPQL